ncbi:MAG: prepilin-type N-terminal cleavage/methylation domain-containing protein [Nitrospirae bacterium]|nr:prepilin-type N-terminal cleavage/methylation domain-containing protein [Nitrospirota bacterium]
MSFFRRPSLSPAISPKGFTLIEVMIALALTATVLAALYSGFFLAERAADTAGRSTRAAFQSRMILDRMARELEAANYLQGDDFTHFSLKDREVFGARSSLLGFTTLASPVGCRSIGYELKDGELFRTEWQPVKKGGEPKSAPVRLPLIKGVKEFSVEARAADKKFVRTWDAELTGSLPRLLRLTMVFDDAEGGETVMVEARPMIGTTL